MSLIEATRDATSIVSDYGVVTQIVDGE